MRLWVRTVERQQENVVKSVGGFHPILGLVYVRLNKKHKRKVSACDNRSVNSLLKDEKMTWYNSCPLFQTFRTFPSVFIVCLCQPKYVNGDDMEG